MQSMLELLAFFGIPTLLSESENMRGLAYACFAFSGAKPPWTEIGQVHLHHYPLLLTTKLTTGEEESGGKPAWDCIATVEILGGAVSQRTVVIILGCRYVETH